MRLFFVVLSLLIFSLNFGACSPLQAVDPVDLRSDEFVGVLSSENAIEGSQPRGDRYLERYSAPSTEQRTSRYDRLFPDTDNQQVERWVKYYSQGNGRENMKVYLARSHRYMNLMSGIMTDCQLPTGLVYMAMAESGFSAWAKSPKGAYGYWQFIPATARRYGLTIDSHIDERRDFVLSTEAACRYLVDLYDMFGDWSLAMAGYNCGENRVARAVSQHQSRNFWYLSNQGALPRETRNYVPKIIAMRRIALNPEDYGFSELSWQTPLSYDLVSINQSMRLSRIAEQLNVDVDELKRLNPKFTTDHIIVNNRELYIRVPPSSI